MQGMLPSTLIYQPLTFVGRGEPVNPSRFPSALCWHARHAAKHADIQTPHVCRKGQRVNPSRFPIVLQACKQRRGFVRGRGWDRGLAPSTLIYKPLTLFDWKEVLCSFPNRSVKWAESQRIVETSLLLTLTIPTHILSRLQMICLAPVLSCHVAQVTAIGAVIRTSSGLGPKPIFTQRRS